MFEIFEGPFYGFYHPRSGDHTPPTTPSPPLLLPTATIPLHPTATTPYPRAGGALRRRGAVQAEGVFLWRGVNPR